MIIGIAGVTSTGKTTMATSIKERYGDRVVVQEKISRQEIYESLSNSTIADFGFKNASSDLRRLTNKQRAMFDMGRVELQILKEKVHALSGRTVVIDGCTLVKIAYLIYLSAPFIVQYFGDGILTEIVERGLEHCNKYYKSIFYLPVTRLPFKEADHRLFKNEYIRTGQDAILNRLMTTKLRDTIDLVRFTGTDMAFVFDELSKMGVN